MLAAYHQVFERVYEDIRHDFTSKYAKRSGFFQLVDSFIRHAFKGSRTYVHLRQYVIVAHHRDDGTAEGKPVFALSGKYTMGNSASGARDQ